MYFIRNFFLSIVLIVLNLITQAQNLTLEQVFSANDFMVSGTTNVQKRLEVDIDPTTGNKVFVWQEDVGGLGNKDIYCAIYTNGMSLISQFVVNATTTGDQAYPCVKINPNDKSFIVAWASYINNTDVNDANKYDIYAKKIRYDFVNADKLVSDLLINTNYVTGNQIIPVVALDYVNNEAVIGWIDQNGRDRLPTVISSDYGSYARRVNYAGTSLALISGANDFPVNSSVTTGHQTLVAIEISPITNELYSVCHQQNFPGGGGGSTYDVVFRKYTRGTGNNYVGATEVLVNSVVTGNQQAPSILVNSKTGDYIVSWQTDSYTGGITGWDSFSKVYDKQGNTIKSEFKVAPFLINNNELGPKPVWDEFSGNVFYFHWYSVGSGTYIRYTAFDKTFTKYQNETMAVTRNLYNSYGVTYKVLYDQTMRKVFMVYDQYNATNPSISNGYYAQMKYNEITTSNTSSQNYVEEQILYKEIKEESLLSGLPVSVATINRTYFDGLGRTIQGVAIQQSPNNNDLVQPKEYDAAGREVKSFLPYTHISGDGAYKNDYATAQAGFYNNNVSNNSDKIINDLYPYSEVVFESSVPNRVSEQSAPGNSWRLGSGHTSISSLTINSASDNIRNWTLTSNGATSTSNYAAGTLYKSTTVDEMGKSIETYTDKFDREICKKEIAPGCSTDACRRISYVIYDDFDNVKYIIPPQATDELAQSGTWTITYNGTSNVDKMIWCNKYDKRQRKIEVKTPGKAVEVIIYNKLNLPVLRQDGNLKASNKWKFVKFDVFGRILMTGIWIDNRTVSAIEADINSKPLFEQRNISSSIAYTNTAYPLINESDVKTILFYDDYNHDFDANPGTTQSYVVAGFSPEPIPVINVKGKVVCSKVRNSINGGWLISINYYDKYQRKIQELSNNHLNQSLQSATTFQYDFGGLTLLKKVIVNSTFDVITTNNRYEYDNNRRLRNTYQKINNDAEILVSSLKYNEAGQLVEKNLHSENSGTSFLQSVDYTYNIRGWLSHINNSSLTNSSTNTTPDDNNNDTNDLFGMEMVFDKTITNGVNQYNGNISGIFWKISNSAFTSNSQLSYVYKYDGYGQLNDAQYGVNNSGTFVYGDKYREKSITYDKNGNIKTLERYNGSPVKIDELVYDYTASGDQLKKVKDNTSNTSGFNDRVDTSIEYVYDSNGNLIADPNKGITSIVYNELNLPTLVQFASSSGERIEYSYDAAGTMLRKKFYRSGSVVYTYDYVNSLFYQNNTIQYVLNSEGRIVTGTTNKYEYFIKDYLGNLRIIVGKNVSGQAEIVQENNYYTFGMRTLNHWSSVPCQLTYGGKEYQEGMDINSDMINEYDWDVYDFGARMYDPVLARWLGVDPADQFSDYTPYGYCVNNPVVNVDPDGRWVGVAIAIGAIVGGYTGYQIAKAKGYDTGDWQTYGYMLGGAAIGTFAGYAGGSISKGGGFMSNTSGIMYSSAAGSIGMSFLSGGMITPGISFGAASYRNGEWSYIGKRGNSTLENLGYGFGALANVQDIVAGTHGANVIVKARPKLAGHSETTGDKITISVGPNQEIAPNLDGLKWEWEYVKRSLKWDPVGGENVSYIKSNSVDVPIYNINGKWLQSMTTRLNSGQNLINSGPLKYGLLYGCVNYNSRALFGAGVLNANALLPITAPLLLNAELMFRQMGIYASPYFTTY